jgi:hypothetical protein
MRFLALVSYCIVFLLAIVHFMKATVNEPAPKTPMLRATISMHNHLALDLVIPMV